MRVSKQGKSSSIRKRDFLRRKRILRNMHQQQQKKDMAQARRSRRGKFGAKSQVIERSYHKKSTRLLLSNVNARSSSYDEGK